MIYRRLGKTGVSVSAFGLGGESALYKLSDKAVRLVRRAYSLGVNYFDTAPLYQDSELVYGEALQGIRDKVFLATKTDQRDYDGAWRQFEASLRRLRVPWVDLLQIHHLDFMDEVDAILDPRYGALRMAEEARAQGLTRFVGVTGHSDPQVLLAAIERHPFDTILMALNPAEVHIESFQKDLLPRAVELDLGILAMKVFARGVLAVD
jgi:aryl-alcohol dehydrogenase-like predicted oxidoreductase